MKKNKYLVFFCIVVGYFIYNLNKVDYVLINTTKYDESYYTQGLEIVDDYLVISTGKYGESQLIKYNFDTKIYVVLDKLDDKYFAEGVTFNGDNLVQLTWKENTVLIRDTKTFLPIHTLHIDLEGWGICFFDKMYYISNGSEYIYIYDINFNQYSKIKIIYKDKSIFRLNELEYYNNAIYANQLDTSFIWKIDIKNGKVLKNMI